MKSTRQWYLRFAVEAQADGSPTYSRLAHSVADDPATLGRLLELPSRRRQPNLLFGAARLLGAPLDDGPQFLAWVAARWTSARAVMAERATQTNEPGRCATLLPVLTSLPQPLALIEVGASAGLCLYPDRYRYRYDDIHVVGPADSPVELACATNRAAPPPTTVPTVVWRAGLDLNPLDVASDDHLRWLDALIWPEHEHRRERLRAAAAIARREPPHLVRGDLLTDLAALADLAPADATLVVFHSAVLSYVADDQRAAFVDTVRALPGHWLSQEAPNVLPEVSAAAGVDDPLWRQMLLALDGAPLALVGGHGQRLDWLNDAR
ncbi:DUF2332 domain-containing protein [Pilimelia columellifera]|uniref:DUF2332 domain-containing protein n=1 Tax=Pilimelia columellifera subsp. columellifera TaxID=706583 RepID=A0ABN3NL10_9ACTN